VLDGIYTGFYLKKKNKSKTPQMQKQTVDVLRNFLVILAWSHDHSLHLKEVNLWSLMGCVTVFAFDFYLPCGVLNHNDVFC